MNNLTLEHAHAAGDAAKAKGFAGVTPYYNVKGKVDGKRVDITGALDWAWLRGYDGLPLEELAK